MNKPEVGQIIYSLNVGNAARLVDQVLTPMVVSKVGRKYFSCHKEGNSYFESQFYLDTWTEKTEYTSNHCLYENKEDYELEKDRSDLVKTVKKFFDTRYEIKAISTEKLKRIVSIINE